MTTRKEHTARMSLADNFRTLRVLSPRLAFFIATWFHVAKNDWDAMIACLSASPYKEWSKSKGEGKGRRYFAAPCPELLLVQRATLNTFLSSVMIHSCRHGGAKGSSLVTNVQPHLGSDHVFVLDIVNAFPSVYRSRVRACLRKPFEFGIKQFAGVTFTEGEKEQMLEAIVDLLVWKDRLPQGPATSPRVFDIVCGKTDQELFELLQKSSNDEQGYRMTIWLDNITISSNKEISGNVRKQIVKVIKDNGFHVHNRPGKMEYYSEKSGKTPVVTGLVLSPSGVTISPDKVNQMRGILHGLVKKPVWNDSEQAKAGGIIGYVKYIYGSEPPAKLKYLVGRVNAQLTSRKESQLQLI